MESIVTLTMNPALDITTDAGVVRPTEKVLALGMPRLACLRDGVPASGLLARR